jgi:hypothetical protein
MHVSSDGELAKQMSTVTSATKRKTKNEDLDAPLDEQRNVYKSINL